MNHQAMFPHGISLSELETSDADLMENENWYTARTSPAQRNEFSPDTQNTPLIGERSERHLNFWQRQNITFRARSIEFLGCILATIFSIPELFHRAYITLNRSFSQFDLNVSGVEIARDDFNFSNPLFEDDNFLQVNVHGLEENERTLLNKKPDSDSIFPEPIMSFRSEPLKLCQLIVPKDSAYDIVVELGKRSLVHFNDLNKDVNVFQRTYVREIKRCSELERCIKYIETQVIEGGAKNSIPGMDTSNVEISLQREIYDLELRLFDLERDIRQMLDNEKQLRFRYNEMIEIREVLTKVEAFFDIHIEDKARNQLEADGSQYNLFGTPLTHLIDHEATTPWFVAGTIDSTKRVPFERVLWRACRRTAFVKTAEITQALKDPETGKELEKSVFIVFFKGQKLKDIVDRVCEGFKAKQYPCPKSSKERMSALLDVATRINDMSTVLLATKDHKLQLLSNAATGLPEWRRQVHLQTAIYHALNNFTFDTSGNFFVAECWVPEKKIDDVMQSLQHGARKSGATVHPILNVMDTEEIPPTYNRTNKFTQIFQDIVDSYGIASYREMNPAPFTIITFPFLFSIMFGDFGHGILMLVAGLYLILNERKFARERSEIFSMFFSGRYIIMLMGAFSIYAGFIYNDAFAKSFNSFGSSFTKGMWVLDNGIGSSSYEEFKFKYSKDPNATFELYSADYYDDSSGPYFMGVDPIWNIAENKLAYINSMKMKLSIIVGVAHMTFGLFLSFFNYRFFHSWVDMYTVFIPQLLFLSCIFLYLCLQIIFKWIFFSVHPGYIFGYEYPGAICAPSLLVGLINMFMFKKRPEGFVNATASPPTMFESCHLTQWYPKQSTVEMVLVSVAFASVPVMLLGKPLIILIQRLTRRGRKQLGHEEPFGEIFMHQAIHTIEFVLGCISHTASYLRLWALSLAHSQLSEVLWDMVLRKAFHAEGYVTGAVMLPFIFFGFALLTLAILVLMEGLSAFLHTLRLHWVEFQSKFYVGEGYPFVPFSLRHSLEKLRQDSDYY